MALRVTAFFLLSSLTAMPAAAQLSCAVFGNIVSCSGPRGSFHQVELGKNRGVIIGNHTTTPYTIMTPPPQSNPRVEPRAPESFMAPSSRPSPFQSPLTPRDSSPYSVRVRYERAPSGFMGVVPDES